MRNVFVFDCAIRNFDGSSCSLSPVMEDRFIEMCTGIEKMVNKHVYMHSRR